MTPPSAVLGMHWPVSGLDRVRHKFSVCACRGPHLPAIPVNCSGCMADPTSGLTVAGAALDLPFFVATFPQYFSLRSGRWRTKFPFQPRPHGTRSPEQRSLYAPSSSAPARPRSYRPPHPVSARRPPTRGARTYPFFLRGNAYVWICTFYALSTENDHPGRRLCVHSARDFCRHKEVRRSPRKQCPRDLKTSRKSRIHCPCAGSSQRNDAPTPGPLCHYCRRGMWLPKTPHGAVCKCVRWCGMAAGGGGLRARCRRPGNAS